MSQLVLLALTAVFGLFFLVLGVYGVAMEFRTPPLHTVHLFFFLFFVLLGAVLMPGVGTIIFARLKDGIVIAEPFIPTFGRRVPLATRIGAMIHFDDSSSDAGALAWFRDPAFRLSYNRAYRDDGTRIRITPSIHDAAYHAGVCLREPGLAVGTLGGTDFRYGAANAGYVGLAITAAAHDHITLEQLDALTTDVAILFRAAGWSPESVEQRIVGHDSRAIFNPRDNPNEPHRWGTLGRKIDPTGFNPSDPVVDLEQLREGVRTYLGDLTAPTWHGWPS